MNLKEYSAVVNNDLTTTPGATTPTPAVTLELVAGRCDAGECPTVYRTGRDTFVIQGFTFEPAKAGMAVPDGEGMVEIPAQLLKDLAVTLL